MPQAKAARWRRWGQAMAKWLWRPNQGRRSGNPRDPKATGPGTPGTPRPRPWLGLQRYLAMAWPRRRIVLPWPVAWHGNILITSAE